MKTVWKHLAVFAAIVLMATVMAMAIPTPSANDQNAVPTAVQSADQKTVIEDSRSGATASTASTSDQGVSAIFGQSVTCDGRNTEQPDYVIRS